MSQIDSASGSDGTTRALQDAQSGLAKGSIQISESLK